MAVQDEPPIDAVISYANADREQVAMLAKDLSAAGLVVWRADPEENGNRWRGEREDKIDRASALIAVWSAKSARSGSIVFEDAKQSDEAGTLISVTIDGSKPPMGFQDHQPIDLSGRDAGGFKALVAAIRKLKSQDSTEDGHDRDVPAGEIAGETATLASLANDLVKAALGGQGPALANATQRMKSALARSETALGAIDAETLLQSLRDQRAHAQVIEIAEVLLSRGEASIKARRLYAQSLIDQGQVNAAIDHLKSALDRVGTGNPEYVEVLGLLGRSHKQVYVNDARSQKAEISKTALKLALDYYAEAVVAKTKLTAKAMGETAGEDVHVEKDVWNGINLIALQALAARDKVVVPKYCEPKSDAVKMIGAIRSDSGDPWEQATLGEAYVACGNFPEAAVHYGKFLGNSDTTPFHINSALRQLREVWQLKPGNGDEGQLLAGIETRMLSASGGTLTVNAGNVVAERASPGQQQTSIFDAVLKESSMAVSGGYAMPETVLGSFGAQPYNWHMELTKRCSAVGRVTVSRKGTIGTGFLIAGADLADEFAGELLFLTNSHVVSGGKSMQGVERAMYQPLQSPPAKPSQIRVVFDAAPNKAPGSGYACSLVWESPISELDVALLRFSTATPSGIEACPIAEEPPPLRVQTASRKARKSRVYVVGYPGGRELAISLDDSHLLDRGPKRLLGPQFGHYEYMHYRTPTESGSSGSPVFDEADWQVVGIHHFGSGQGKIRSLDGTKLWRANEGVSIFSVRDAVRKAIASGEIKRKR